MTLTHRMASPTKDTGFPSQELLVAKLELVSVMRHSASSLPPLLVIAVNPKTIVRNSQINPLCLWVVLGRVLEIETHRSHLEEVAPHLETFRRRHRRLEAPGNHSAFPSWRFYVFLGTFSIPLASFLQYTQPSLATEPRTPHALFVASPE